MKKLLTILSLLVTSTAFGQGFTYSYVDPCSKKLKTLYLENNQSVTVNYLGVIGTFTQGDFQNGAFSTWVQGVQSQVTSQPCDELKTQAQVTQNLIITQNIISTLTSITAASTMNIASSIGGASNSIGNSVDNSSNSSSKKGPRNNNRRNNGNSQSNSGDQTNSSGTQNGGQSTGSPNTQSGTANPSPGAGNNGQGGNSTNPNNPTEGGSGSSQPAVGSSGQNGSSNPPSNGQPGSGQGGQSSGGSSGGSGTGSNPSTGSSGESNGSGSNTGGGSNGGSEGSSGSSSGGGSNGSGSGGQSGATDTKKPDESTPKQTESGGGNGGTTNSVSNAAEASSSNSGGGSKVRVGSLIGTGDIVAIRSAEDQSNQFKGTMSMTKSNTNNTRAKGFLLNFTTTINNSNLTFYGAFSNKTKTNTLIVANSSMIDFDRNFFNTTTALESKRFGKLSLMGGLNFTAGFLADESFSNISGVGGGFYPFKASKNLTGTVLLLGVYSPYTKFYEGKWWDSGILLVPFTSWDYAISKNFKYNVSFSGTYQVKGSVLNYQILTGGKILL
jgi:hypothetical protein